MLNIIKNTINRVFASGVDSDASAFITATGLSGTTQKSAITTLVKDLKSSGLWSKMKAVYPMVTDNYNLLSYTEDFTNAAWTKANTSATANSIIAPDGNTTADILTDTAANAVHYCVQTTAQKTNRYNYSIYLKYQSLQYVAVDINDGTNGIGIVVNIQNGTYVGTMSVGSGFTLNSYAITSVGNGWYRCSVDITFTGAGSASAEVVLRNSNTTSWGNAYVGSGNGVYLWGAQLEQSSTLSAYQPVLGSQQALIASQMKYNLKDARDLDAAFRLTWSGGWTYSATGATPNGTNAYADTNFNPRTNLTIASSHQTIYNRVNANDSGFRGVWDGGGATYRLEVALNSNSFANNCVVSSNGAVINFPTVANDSGFIQGNSISTGLTWNRNGSMVQSAAAGSAIFPNRNYYLGALNNNGTPGFYSNMGMSFFSLGDGMTSQEIQLFNQIVEKYQVALSRGVQAAQSFYYNSAYSNEANTYLYSTQITGTTQVSAINTLINGLKANNLWTKMKAVYPFVTDYRNILAYTEDFNNGFWAKNTTATVTPNTATAPDGTLTADTITPGSTGYVFITLSNNGVTQTYSCHVKKKSDSICYHGVYSGTDLGFFYNFDTQTIVNTLGSISNATATNLGNGWFRLSFTFTNAASTTLSLPAPYNFNGVSYTKGTDQYIWGAQLELGSNLSAYQPVLAANNYATNVAAQMKFNLVNPQDTDAAFRLAFSGGWTYSTNGAQPNGTNGYADTKYKEISADTNNFHIATYLRTNIAGAYGDMGVVQGANETNIVSLLSGKFYGRVQGAEPNGITNADSRGLFMANRISSSQLKVVKNNTVTNIANNSTGISPTYNIYLSAFNQNGSAIVYSPRQTAFASIGEGLSDAEVALFYQLIQQYQTDLSRNV